MIITCEASPLLDRVPSLSYAHSTVKQAEFEIQTKWKVYIYKRHKRTVNEKRYEKLQRGP